MLLEQLMVAQPREHTLVIPIIGEPGTGKSHLIKWLRVAMPNRDDLVIRHIPREGTCAFQRSFGSCSKGSKADGSTRSGIRWTPPRTRFPHWMRPRLASLYGLRPSFSTGSPQGGGEPRGSTQAYATACATQLSSQPC